jgi:hypothetical protein
MSLARNYEMIVAISKLSIMASQQQTEIRQSKRIAEQREAEQEKMRQDADDAARLRIDLVKMSRELARVKALARAREMENNALRAANHN